jgi:hypothetical protein
MVHHILGISFHNIFEHVFECDLIYCFFGGILSISHTVVTMSRILDEDNDKTALNANKFMTMDSMTMASTICRDKAQYFLMYFLGRLTDLYIMYIVLQTLGVVSFSHCR